MKTLFLGKNCIEVEKIDSTNSYLSRLQEETEVFEGTLVVANHQAQGKGQRGTSWDTEPDKNLTISIFLQPVFLKPEGQFHLNKVISLGVMETIISLLLLGKNIRAEGSSLPEGLQQDDKVAVKWPNDIYIGSKKVAGILIENSVIGNKLLHSIVGIGINVNQDKFSAALPNPTSLKLVFGKEFDLKVCLEQLCLCIERRYLQLRNSSKEIDSDYLNSLYRFEEWSDYNFKGEAIKAQIKGVTNMGKLMLQTEKGEGLECDFKEVSFCK